MWNLFSDILGEFFEQADRGSTAQQGRSHEFNAIAAQARAERAESSAGLQDRMDRQALVIQALLAICVQKQVFTAQEFREMLLEIDMQDGVRDGKAKPDKTPQVCPSCNKNNSHKLVTCMYCGTELGQGISI
ncbi:MAG: hypothetical protein KDB07_09220 [Planctomycetes bacterium]|nr:hypothetical protein [Planctomycetota bacterium]